MHKKIKKYIKSIVMMNIVFFAGANSALANDTSYDDTMACSSLFFVASVIAEDSGNTKLSKSYLGSGKALLQSIYDMKPEKNKKEIENELKKTMFVLLEVHERNPAEFKVMILEFGAECVKLAETLIK